MAGLITILILIPLAGAIVLSASRFRNPRLIALIFNALSAYCAVMLLRKFSFAAGGMQLIERHAWIPSIDADDVLGAD